MEHIAFIGDHCVCVAGVATRVDGQPKNLILMNPRGTKSRHEDIRDTSPAQPFYTLAAYLNLMGHF